MIAVATGTAPAAWDDLDRRELATVMQLLEDRHRA